MISSFTFALLVVTFCAFIGWITNWLAIMMIFRPYERIQIIGPIGWQGILARNAGRFARDVADMITAQFFRPRDLALQVDPAVIHRAAWPLAEPAIDSAIVRFRASLPPAVAESPLLSADVLAELKQQLLDEIERLAPAVHELTLARVDALVDLHAEIVANLTGGNVGRLEEFILTVAGKEFRWIEWYGAIFGAFFGFLQIGLGSLGLTSLWAIPVTGIVVGLVTNWIAIWMIFAPREPVRLGPFVLQGAFPRRRVEIALSLASVVNREFRFGMVLDAMIERGFGRELRDFVGERLTRFLTPRLAPLGTIFAGDGVTISAEEIVADALDEITPHAPSVLAAVKHLAEEQIDVLGLVRARLEDMDTLRFEGVIRGLVQEDEWILVGYGGLLGAVIGFAQMGLVAALW